MKSLIERDDAQTSPRHRRWRSLHFIGIGLIALITTVIIQSMITTRIIHDQYFVKTKTLQQRWGGFEERPMDDRCY
jgi:hypothetical protein